MLKNDPFSRRIFLSAWNSADLDKTCLPPCHVSIQFFVEEKNGMKYLSLKVSEKQDGQQMQNQKNDEEMPF